MQKKVESPPRGPSRDTLSRREVLAGAAIVALAASAPAILAAPAKSRQKGRATTRTESPLRRYMAASALLGDGRILVTGGYDRPWADGPAPASLNSAMIYDPKSSSWTIAASMASPRARHAAVSLADGRVAVLGGIGMTATASVEIYDPSDDSWTQGTPLSQPRYDHSAAMLGGYVYVLGGSSSTMIASTEIYQPQAGSRS